MYKILFNFSSSYSGGGLKRLEEFSKWFAKNGGASFLINEKSKYLIEQFPQNNYTIPKITKISRILNQENYFDILEKNNFDLYYSYGIPITQSFTKVNLLHITNVLPFLNDKFGYSFVERAKFRLLRNFFYKSLDKTDVLTAESNYSIHLFKDRFKKQKYVSKNGSDEEIKIYNQRNKQNVIYENYAIVLGTGKHKNVRNSFLLFQELLTNNANLKLKIIGDSSLIPQDILENENTEILGVLQRDEIIKLLSKAKYYISTTEVENSYNAASEAIFLAEESYISAIEPHQELLENLPYETIDFNDIKIPVIKVESKKIDIRNLVTWDQVILEILEIYNNANSK